MANVQRILDTDTKRRIDTALDILVGKAPNPKSQVEQIAIAEAPAPQDSMAIDASGCTERLYRVRRARRDTGSNPSNKSTPSTED